MQEELENRVVVMIESGTKLTASLLKRAICAYLDHQKQNRMQIQKNLTSEETVPEKHGEISVEDLAKQGKSLQSIPINGDTIGDFSHYARKFGVDYAPFRIDGEDKYLVFFKGADRNAIQAAFTAYTQNQADRAKQSPVVDRLKEIKAQMKHPKKNKVRKQVKER